MLNPYDMRLSQPRNLELELCIRMARTESQNGQSTQPNNGKSEQLNGWSNVPNGLNGSNGWPGSPKKMDLRTNGSIDEGEELNLSKLLRENLALRENDDEEIQEIVPTAVHPRFLRSVHRTPFCIRFHECV